MDPFAAAGPGLVVGRVNTASALYALPSRLAPVVGQRDAGAEVEVVARDTQGEWLDCGQQGWLPASALGELQSFGRPVKAQALPESAYPGASRAALNQLIAWKRQEYQSALVKTVVPWGAVFSVIGGLALAVGVFVLDFDQLIFIVAGEILALVLFTQLVVVRQKRASDQALKALELRAAAAHDHPVDEWG